MSRRSIGLLICFCLLAQGAVWGQEASPHPSASPAGALTPLQNTGGMFQLVAYFVLIVVLLGAGLYLTRSGGFAALAARNKGDRKLVISETRGLGNRQFLIVAEYENRKMLLGVCPGRIDYLSTLAGGNDETFELPEKAE